MKSIFILISMLVSRVTLTQDFYKAAVLEHHPMKSQNVHADFSNNLRYYLEQLEQAAYQDVDIMVFPEDGLTGWVIDPNDLIHLSTEVPDPKSAISPCTDRSKNYTHFLVELSCACKRHQIYGVFNIIEVANQDAAKKIYHNTNVAIDRAGVLVAKYRKINLYDEFLYVPGSGAVSVFSTDFGVKFGMFICFDIGFQSPSINILKDNGVTDIVYSTAWFAQLPFYIANSVQHGYAKSNGVNLLAAGLNDPAIGMGGSGIYLADGSIASQFISGRKMSKLIIANVPKINSRSDLSNTCQHASTDSSYSSFTDMHLFHTNPTDLTNYTIHSLNMNDLQFSETICAESSDFCCTFNFTVNKYLPGPPNYSYKLILYDGVSAVSQTKTIGLRQCALIACGNDSVTSCTYKNEYPPTGVYFEHISITGTFNNVDADYLPSTATYNLLPTGQYVYCKKTEKDSVDVSMYTTQKLDGLLTFGIFGRVFSNDNKPPGAVSLANYNYSQFKVYYIMAFIILQFY